MGRSKYINTNERQERKDFKGCGGCATAFVLIALGLLITGVIFLIKICKHI